MPMDCSMRSLKNRKLYLQVYDELRDYILKNKLQAGDKLPTEMEMCESLGVSRNVLREAIKSLEITGAIKSKPGVGIIVQEFSPDFLFQSLFYSLAGDSEQLLSQTLAVRRTLELGFLQQSFDSIGPEDIVLLKQQVSVMEKICLETQSKRTTITRFGHEFYDADATFHKTLYRSTGNSILCSIIDAVWACDKYHKTRVNKEHVERTVQKHTSITEALEAHNFEQYSSAMHYHFDVGYKVSL